MRPIQVCLTISKELRDSYQGQGIDYRFFREAAEMLGRKLLEDGILEQHLEPDINRREFHYILILNRKEEKKLPEGLEEEISRYLREECAGDDEPSVSDIARHFAEWGATHVKK